MRRALVLGSLVLAAGCARPSRPATAVSGTCASGTATYYADSLAGRPTASGEPYDPGAFTAASRDFAFGTWVRVAWGERVVTVRVNDRGPFRGDGVVDVSRAAAESLGMIRAGRVPVRVCAL